MNKSEPTHAQIIERVGSVQAELTELKDDFKDHRDDSLTRLRRIETQIAGLKGGWKVLMVLGSILAGTLAAIASIIAIMKGVR